MYYYKRHLGDYARKAGHLTMLEHGAYTLILDGYYDREQAPTKAEAIRWARARTQEEIAAVEVVLLEFFTEVNGRMQQNRVEEEFVIAESVATKNRENGALGGRPRKPKGNPDVTQTKPSGLFSETQTKGNPLIHQSINPSQEQNQKKDHSAAKRGTRINPDYQPSQKLIDWLHTERPDLDARKMTEAFVDYWEAKAGAGGVKLDWDKTWKTWARNQRGQQNGTKQKLSLSEQAAIAIREQQEIRAGNARIIDHGN